MTNSSPTLPFSHDWGVRFSDPRLPLRVRLALVLALGALALALAGPTACKKNSGDGTAPAPANNVDARHRIRVEMGMYTDGAATTMGERICESGKLAREWEALHPGFKIEFGLMVGGDSPEGEWIKTQLIGGTAPAFLHQNAEVAWPDVDKGWYVPLDEFLERPNPYVKGNKRWFDLFANPALVNARRAPDGKLYCLPFDQVGVALFYNKDIFRKAGIERLPQTWAEMLDVYKKLDEYGVTPMTDCGFGSGADWGQSVIFEMLYHDILPLMDLIPPDPDSRAFVPNFLESPEMGFLITKGFFTHRDPRWRESLRIVKEWRRYWSKELKNTDTQRLFVTSRAATYFCGSWFINRLISDPYIDFDWGVMNLPPITQATSPYGKGYPASTVGGAGVQLHITNSTILNGNLEETIDFLMFITAPQNYERIINEPRTMLPIIKGVEAAPSMQPFVEINKHNYYCASRLMFATDGRWKTFWQRWENYFINDGFADAPEGEVNRFVNMLEVNLQDWVASKKGQKDWDFSKYEPIWKQREAQLLRELDPE